MKNQTTEAAATDQNLAVLANAVELGAQAVLNVAGNAIANTVDGKPVSASYLQEAIAARMQAALAPSTGGQ